eukprot:122516-Rhodomonas_salina.2
MLFLVLLEGTAHRVGLSSDFNGNRETCADRSCDTVALGLRQGAEVHRAPREAAHGCEKSVWICGSLRDEGSVICVVIVVFA